MLEELPERLGKRFGMPPRGQADVAKGVLGIVAAQPGGDGRADNRIVFAVVQGDELREGFQTDLLARMPGRSDQSKGGGRAQFFHQDRQIFGKRAARELRRQVVFNLRQQARAEAVQ